MTVYPPSEITAPLAEMVVADALVADRVCTMGSVFFGNDPQKKSTEQLGTFFYAIYCAYWKRERLSST